MTAILHRLLVREKLNNPLGFIILLVVSLALAYIIGTTNEKVGMILLAGVIGVPILFTCIFNLRVGIAVAVTASFFILGVRRVVQQPLGTLLDALVFMLFLGLCFKHINGQSWKWAKSPISVMIVLWILYNLIEGLNPWAPSHMAWVYTVRAMAILSLIYFMILYEFKDFKYFKFMVKLIIGLAAVATLYGLFQEFYGLLPFERRWLYKDMHRFKLYYQWNHLRIFSFMSDPMVFGIHCAYMSMFCFALMMGPFKWYKRLLLGVLVVLMLMALSYSGTRTAVVLMPVGMIFYILLTMRKEVFIIVGILLLMGSAFMLKSTGSVIVYRMQSSFKIQKDASMQIRLDNQKNIQPFIRSHPFGGGLGSTGIWGLRFSPSHHLAGFPPDSTYVRIGVEQGWIGLFIYMMLWFVVMRTGVRNYLRTKDPELKAYYTAFLVLAFMLMVANYPQEASTQIPTSIILYTSMAALVVIRRYDKKRQQLKQEAEQQQLAATATEVVR